MSGKLKQLQAEIERDLPELPQGINVPMIEMIHSGVDGYIPFMRKDPDTGGLRNLFSLPKETLRTYFPEMMRWLLQDAYMGINTCYRPAPWVNKKTGLPDAKRGEDELRYLNAVYSDLDVGRPNDPDVFKRQPWAKALAVAEIMMGEGVLPQASIYARSGRGLYLLWLLRDPDDPNKPQKAWQEKIELYKRINKAIAGKLHKLASDPQAIDAARVLKVPGTLDSKSGRQVGYWFRLDDSGMPFIHTLQGLADALLKPASAGHELPPAPGGYLQPIPTTTIRKVKEKGKHPKKIAGWDARNIVRVSDLLKIENWLGGFPQGKRRRSLCLLAECMKFSGTDRGSAHSLLESKAARCRPPYPTDETDDPIDAIVKATWGSGARLARSGNEAICKYYGITGEIALQLELQSIMPKKLKLEIEADEKAQAKRERAEEKRAYWAEIEAAIKRLWHGSGKACSMSYRRMADELTAAGFPVSFEKIRRLFKEGKIDKRFKPKR